MSGRGWGLREGEGWVWGCRWVVLVFSKFYILLVNFSGCHSFAPNFNQCFKTRLDRPSRSSDPTQPTFVSFA